MKKLQILTIVFLLLGGFAQAGTFYISPAGNDNNNGSISNPWRTINKANAALKPGDIVYLRQGNYSQTIKPARSGSAGNYITYARYNNENVVLTNVSIGADLLKKSYIIIDGIKMLNTRDKWVELSGGKHNIIRNCYMEEAGSWAGIALGPIGSSYNKIINNTLIGNCGPADLILMAGGSYNLIEGNDLTNGMHNSIGIQSKKGQLPSYYNVIRNNKVRNVYHTGISNYPDSHHTLIEGNIIVDSGEEYFNNSCGSERDRNMERKIHSGIKVGSSKGIIRNNVLVNNGTGIVIERKGEDYSGGSDNHIYNNTFNENHLGIKNSTVHATLDNVIKNNILYENKENEIFINNNENYYINNNIVGTAIYKRPDGNIAISALESKYPGTWNKNVKVNPQFKDKGNRNYNLQASSPMIDSGDFLTKATNSGSGTSLTVEDAGYFMDGWGVIEGDIIQLEGQNVTARIVKINGNTMTLDRSLTWNKGQGVNLAYSGSAPEIGAFEVNNGTSPSNTPPSISELSDHSIEQDKTMGPVTFTINDKETAAGSLVLTAASTNQNLVKNSNIKIGGSGKNRNITIIPEKGKYGNTEITVTVSDGKAKSSNRFQLTVSRKEAANTAPIVSEITDQIINKGESPQKINFTVRDAETASNYLAVMATSGNTSLVDKSGITLGGSGKDRIITISPKAGAEGTTTITVSVSDGSVKSGSSFKLTVQPGTGKIENPANSDAPVAFAINSGGGEVNYMDENWQVDQYAKGGRAFSSKVEIAGTENDKIYQTSRYGNIQYEIPLAKGIYDIKLHFAETYHGIRNSNSVGARVFNVEVENSQEKLLNYDIIEKAGGPAKAVVEDIKGINISDGFLTIALSTIKDKALISGIEVTPVENTNSVPVVKNPGNKIYQEEASVSLQIKASDPDENSKLTYNATGLPAPLSINSTTGLIEGQLEAKAGEYAVLVKATDEGGLFVETAFNIIVTEIPVVDTPVDSKVIYAINSGGAEVNYKNENWQADQYATGGRVYSNNIEIAGTANDKIYQSVRFDNQEYEIPLPNGSYDLKLHFAETYFGVVQAGGIGSRVFNVNIEDGQSALRNYDIIKSAGGPATAVVEHIKGIDVSDGFLTISLTGVRENAKISAIEIISLNSDYSTNQVATKLTVYPNPVGEKLTIDFGTTRNSKINLSIFDKFGIEVYKEIILAEFSNRPYEIDLSNYSLKSGEIYYIQTIEAGSIKKSAKIIKK